MSFFARNIEFYDFARGAMHWRYVSENRPLSYLGQAYGYASIKRGRLAQSQELTRNTLDLTVPETLPLLDLYRGGAPLDIITVTMYQQRKSNGVTAVAWMGELGSVSFGSGGTATIHCLPPMAGLKANGLKRCWQKGCGLVVFSAGRGQCNAQRAAMRVDATLTSVSGSEIKAAAFAGYPSNWFANGDIEWQAGVVTERRFVTSHTGDTLTLLTPAGAGVGTVVAAYPGCDQSLATCDAKFHNAVNYGGQPWLPQKNPFGSDSVF